MATVTRPYFMILDGVQHMVEAAGPAQAVRHIVGAALTELRPARGAEVAAWNRAGKEIPIAGLKPVPAGAGDSAHEPEHAFTAGHAFLWLADWTKAPQAEIKPVWERCVATKRMTLEDYDTLRAAVPRLGSALVAAVAGDNAEISGADIRGALEEEPMDIVVVVGAIEQAHRTEPDAE